MISPDDIAFMYSCDSAELSLTYWPGDFCAEDDSGATVDVLPMGCAVDEENGFVTETTCKSGNATTSPMKSLLTQRVHTEDATAQKLHTMQRSAAAKAATRVKELVRSARARH